MELYEIVNKLIGEINPIGESSTDEERFENFKKYCELTAKMLSDINYIADAFKNSYEFSVKRTSDYAIKFQKNIGL